MFSHEPVNILVLFIVAKDVIKVHIHTAVGSYLLVSASGKQLSLYSGVVYFKYFFKRFNLKWFAMELIQANLICFFSQDIFISFFSKPSIQN